MKKIVFAAVFIFGLQSSFHACEFWMLQRSPLYRNFSIFPVAPRQQYACDFEWENIMKLDYPPIAVHSSYKFKPVTLLFPRGAVFCRMETYTQKKIGVMFSIHAGVYQERY